MTVSHLIVGLLAVAIAAWMLNARPRNAHPEPTGRPATNAVLRRYLGLLILFVGAGQLALWVVALT